MEIKVEANFYKEYENKVNIPYYRENADAGVCASSGIDIINRIVDNGINLEKKVFFNMITEVIQMATESNMLQESMKMIDIASYYMDDCGWDFAILQWREAELSFKKDLDWTNKNSVDEVFQKYINTLEEYLKLHKEHPNYKPEKMKNNIVAIKYQMGSNFENQYYMTEAMLDTIEIFKDNICTSLDLRLTYDEFKRIVNDMHMIKNVKRSLKLNKIVL